VAALVATPVLVLMFQLTEELASADPFEPAPQPAVIDALRDGVETLVVMIEVGVASLAVALGLYLAYRSGSRLVDGVIERKEFPLSTVGCVREVATETDVEAGRCVTCDAREVDGVHRVGRRQLVVGGVVVRSAESFRVEECLACWRAEAVAAAARARLDGDDLDAFLAIGEEPAPRSLADELEPAVVRSHTSD
jgi:hypothetical protein